MQGKFHLVGCRSAAIFASLLLLTLACDLQAGTPVFSQVLPRGIQRGTEADLVIRGSHFEDAHELMLYSPGVTVTAFEVKSPTEIHAHVRVDKDAAIGEYCARVHGDTGISDLRTFYVTPFPIIPFEVGKPDRRGRVYYDFEHPQVIKELNVTVTGSVAPEQAQYFAVDMKKGQRLTAEVHGMRLAEKFDPYLAILDEKRFELAISDDTALAMQDSIASTVIPADGRYIILLRESTYAQGSHYLLHIGTFPRPTVIYPLGGRPGESLHVKYLGDVAGPFDATIKLPDHPIDSFPVLPEQSGLIAPSPNHARVSDMPNVLEQEPNDSFESATAYAGPIPVAFNGIIEKASDVDFFKFKAKRGEQLEIRVIARVLRSPLDSVLSVYDSKGRVISTNDDSGGPDSYLRLNVPKDDEYAISVTDQLHNGGVDYVYRVEITPAKPELTLTIPQVAQYSQDRWTIPVPRGNRYATMMRATRTNTGGDVTVQMPNLPPGITFQSVDGSQSEFPVVFEARPDAQVGAKLCTLSADLINGEKKVDVDPRYIQKVDLVFGQNQSTLYYTKVDELAVAVTKEAPFKLHLEQPKVPLVQGGSMDLKVTALRDPNFKSPIQVRLLFTPPGVSGLPYMDMSGDQSTIAYPLNAQANAALKKWKICIVGSADVNGEVWVSSELVDLEVGEPYLVASSRMTPIEQGKSGVVTYKLEQRTPFPGKAKAKLQGLPANCTSDVEVEITSADTTVSFPVTVGEKASVGNHPTLFCNVVVMKDGEPIVHNIGRGGSLRVDKPEGTKGTETSPVAAGNSKGKIAEASRTSVSRAQKLDQGQKQK